MVLSSECEAIEVLSRRIDFLEFLRETVAYKPELVDTLEHSRSTVDRAVDELMSEGLIERGEDGYVLTQSGKLAANRYRLFLDETQTILDTKDLIDSIPATSDLPIELFTNANVVTVDGAYGVFTQVADLLPEADRYQVVLPEVFDSQHVRLLHSQVVREELEIELLASPSVIKRLRKEFPELSNELADAESFSLSSVSTPPYSLILTSGSANRDGKSPQSNSESERSGVADTDTVIMIPYGNDGVAGMAATSDVQAVTWATNLYEQLREDSSPGTEQLRTQNHVGAMSTLTGVRLPLALRSEGFSRLDRAFFQQHERIPPGASWRAGLGLPEVDAGYAVERHRRNGSSLTDVLLSRLEDSTDLALIGPAGSGKSTVCKQVACRWRAEHDGIVLYRESGSGGAFQSGSALESTIEQATVPVLIVVEDALRLEACEIFEVMRSVSGRDEVTFLLDARDNEWKEPRKSGLNARVDAFRREYVDVVSMPPVDEEECRRIVDDAETILDTSLDIDSADLLSEIRSSVEDTTTPGTMLLLTHRIARDAIPVTNHESSGLSTLDEDIDSVRTALEEIGEIGLDAGVLLNTLNAGGIEISPALVYPVASLDEVDEKVQVQKALELLEGHVVFDQPGNSVYRCIHESWSVRFLERLLEVNGEHAASQRFGRSLSALYGLADEPERCDRLSQTVSGRNAVLDRIVADPTEWVDETIETIFEMGLTNARVAPLFGVTERSAIDLPDACSAKTEARCTELRGNMYRIAGELTRARTEFKKLEMVATERGYPGHEATSLSQLGQLDQKEGKYDRAKEYYKKSLELRREIGDEQGEARSLNDLGMVANERGEYDRARENCEKSLRRSREIGNRRGEAQSLHDLGTIVKNLGEYDHAQEYLEKSLEIRTETGDRQGEAQTLHNLGIVADIRGNYDQSRTHYERSLAIKREIGDRHGQASTLNNLGIIAHEQALYDRAHDRYTRSLEIKQEIGDRKGEARGLHNLAVIDRIRGRYERAEGYYEQSLKTLREIGDSKGESQVLGGLGIIAKVQGDYDRAQEYYEQCLEIKQEIGDKRGEGSALNNLGIVLYKKGNIEQARECVEESIEIFREIGDRNGEAESLNTLGNILLCRGDYDRAQEYYEQSLSLRCAVEDQRGETATRNDLAELFRQRGEYTRALENNEKALDIARDIDYPKQEASALLGIGATRRLRGEYKRALESIANALEQYEETGNQSKIAEARLARGRLELTEGNVDDARKQAEQAQLRFEQLDEPHSIARSRRLLGEISVEDGNIEMAYEHWQCALEGFGEVGARRDSLETLRQLIESSRQQGDSERSREWCRRADSVIDDSPDQLSTEYEQWIESAASSLGIDL
ncbi:tetratricopeptide repeat protein [Natrialbaceae archaeon A-chndr2]|uniref:Tetratricopeptide repeat protein n=1 Tax=Natronosalvus hydrolyticus TaxID=2979988 RepID=A0AAP3E6W2_9EURY|nr:tetratricopeptide repeat protein [Halobacteria archaeon AArc-curdl1]